MVGLRFVIIYKCERVKTNSTECVGDRIPGMSNREVFTVTAAALGYKSTASRPDYSLKQERDAGMNRVRAIQTKLHRNVCNCACGEEKSR